MARLADIDANRIDRQNRRRQHRKLQTENFLKSLHMLQANNYLRESEDPAAFEDYSIFMYRQNAPEFNDRVKELEQKLLYPVRTWCRLLFALIIFGLYPPLCLMRLTRSWSLLEIFSAFLPPHSRWPLSFGSSQKCWIIAQLTSLCSNYFVIKSCVYFE